MLCHLCDFCHLASPLIEIDETSHLGKRHICHSCIGARDELRMRQGKGIILFRSEWNVVNSVGTLSFKIKEIVGGEGISFIVFKKRWQGKLIRQTNVFYCSKLLTSSLTKEKSNV